MVHCFLFIFFVFALEVDKPIISAALCAGYHFNLRNKYFIIGLAEVRLEHWGCVWCGVLLASRLWAFHTTSTTMMLLVATYVSSIYVLYGHIYRERVWMQICIFISWWCYFIEMSLNDILPLPSIHILLMHFNIIYEELFIHVGDLSFIFIKIKYRMFLFWAKLLEKPSVISGSCDMLCLGMSFKHQSFSLLLC